MSEQDIREEWINVQYIVHVDILLSLQKEETDIDYKSIYNL